MSDYRFRARYVIREPETEWGFYEVYLRDPTGLPDMLLARFRFRKDAEEWLVFLVGRYRKAAKRLGAWYVKK